MSETAVGFQNGVIYHLDTDTVMTACTVVTFNGAFSESGKLTQTQFQTFETLDAKTKHFLFAMIILHKGQTKC